MLIRPVSGDTGVERRAAVLGRPVAHSLSPVLHRCAYDVLGLTGWSYELFDLGADELAGFLASRDPSWVGFSCTMPLKEQALLEVESASPLALQTGAVNTVIRSATGWVGDNTDVAGVLGALGGKVGAHVREAVIIGSGATGRSVLAALSALGVESVTFVVRSQARESTLAQARDHGIRTTVLGYDDAGSALLGAPLVVSAVPAHGADAVMNHLGRLADGRLADRRGPRDRVWLDVVYAGWPTLVAQVGRQLGATVVSGVDLLVYQAAEQVRLMTGRQAPVEAMLAAGHAALRDRRA